ncbi:hypothetical protein BH23PSE1_BH23PSE1_12720 [soil metagenome]
MVEAVRPPTGLGAVARRGEFAAIFLAGPLVLALALPPSAMAPALLGSTALAAILLSLTAGFRWAELLAGFRSVEARLVAGVAALTALAATGLVFWLIPGQWLFLPRRVPDLWLTILVLYPFISALPQEIVFRLLFFRRYGWLFANRHVAITVNAGVFALAHLMFWNWPAFVMTFAGGWIFAFAYLQAGGFWGAVVLHVVAGSIVFTTGLGTFFYHGAVAG